MQFAKITKKYDIPHMTLGIVTLKLILWRAGAVSSHVGFGLAQ